MKNNIIRMAFAAMIVLSFVSCEKEVGNFPGTSISYSVSVDGMNKGADTKGALYNTSGTNKDLSDFVTEFTASAYNGTEALFTNKKVKYASGAWTMDDRYYWPQQTVLTFFASANVPSTSSVSTTSDGMILSHEVPASVSEQKDVLLGYYSGKGGYDGTAELKFSHPLTAVLFKAGTLSGEEVVSITMAGLAKEGTVAMDSYGKTGTWDVDDYSLISTQSKVAGLDKSDDGTLGEAFILIPQNLSSVAGHPVKVSVVFKSGQSASATLDSGVWRAGRTNTYTLSYSSINYSLTVTPWDEVESEMDPMIPSGDGWICYSAPTNHTLKGYFTPNEDLAEFDRHFSYSYDTVEWTEWDSDNVALTFGGDKKLYIRGNNPDGPRGYTLLTDHDVNDDEIVADVTLSGNIMSLINPVVSQAVLTPPDFDIFSDDYPDNDIGLSHFKWVFKGCNSIVDASDLKLPAEVLQPACYDGMFTRCTNLIYAPELPSTTLSPACYSYMFEDCESLETPPALPATTVEVACYDSMFHGCTSLKTAPELKALKMESHCYWRMFGACESLEKAPELPSLELAPGCYGEMFRWCKKLEEMPELPATTLAPECYDHMFCGSSLKKVKKLDATLLADNCYSYMFFECDELIEGPSILPATDLASHCYEGMFSDCPQLTSVPALPAMNLADYCYSRMFTRCESITDAPVLPATVMKPYCYSTMFQGCKSLSSAPELPAMSMAEHCYEYMLSSCDSITDAPVLPATDLASHCYEGMFWGCVQLTTAPVLPADYLIEGCYVSMFRDCSNLNYVKVDATSGDPALNKTLYWLEGVSDEGTIVYKSCMPIGPVGIYVPGNWAKITEE